MKLGIRHLALRTGLSQHTIRAWERRYHAVTPQRTGTNRRVYSEEDVRKLRLLQRAVAAGHSIGRVAGLPSDELEQLVVLGGPTQSITPPTEPTVQPAEESLRLVEAAIAGGVLDTAALCASLRRASALYGIGELVDEVIRPLLERVGDLWQQDKIGIALEHAVSAEVRTQLGRTFEMVGPRPSAPRLLVTTPAGQHHELGALAAAVVAAAGGWDVAYLGPNLPAAEIASAVRRSGARAVALGITWPGDDELLRAELRALHANLPRDCALLVGGSAAPCYRDELKRLEATLVPAVNDLCRILAGLQTVQPR